MPEPYEQMLADTYDAQYAVLRDPSGDREFYATLAAETGGPVLEIGCGTGRVLLPIARAGHTAVGVDPSAAMLEVFRAKGLPENLTLVCGRAQDLALEQRDFGLATMPFRAFMHLERTEDQLETLRRIRSHLRPDGWLALDVFDPDLARMAALEESGEQPSFPWHQRTVVRRYAVTRDHAHQLQSVRFDYTDAQTGESLGTETVTMRWTYRYELEHLLVRAGFEPFRWSSGYDERPYIGKGDIVVVAQRA
jgi:SAM-dependent methyltransferase